MEVFLRCFMKPVSHSSFLRLITAVLTGAGQVCKKHSVISVPGNICNYTWLTVKQ